LSPYTLSTQAKVSRILDKVREFYELGEKSRDLPKSERSQFDEGCGVDANRMRRARGFAREYGQGALKRFLSLRKPDGLPLHVGYVPYLLIVKDPKERRRLEVAAAKHGWTVPDLIAEIQRRHPTSQGAHGRRVKPPAGLDLGIQQLVTTGILWKNRSDVVVPMVRNCKPKGEGDRRRLQNAATTFEELGTKALELAKALKAILGQRKT